MKKVLSALLFLAFLSPAFAQSAQELRAMVNMLTKRVEALEATVSAQQNDIDETKHDVRKIQPQVVVGNDQMIVTGYQNYIDSLRALPVENPNLQFVLQDSLMNSPLWDSLAQKAGVLIINKETMTISRIDYKGKIQATYGIACGRNYGNKRANNDCRTPEGVFRIKYISDLRNDSLIRIFGPHFMCLDCPFEGIGVHGTGSPNSIGKRVSHGCIRLHNQDIRELRKACYVGMPVIILPSRKDVAAMNIAAPDGPEPPEEEQLPAEEQVPAED